MTDENNYLKHRTIRKKCHNENKRENINNIITENEIVTTPNNQKSIKSTTTLFQNMKITLMLLLVQETSAKPITCSKYLKK